MMDNFENGNLSEGENDNLGALLNIIEDEKTKKVNEEKPGDVPIDPVSKSDHPKSAADR